MLSDYGTCSIPTPSSPNAVVGTSLSLKKSRALSSPTATGPAVEEVPSSVCKIGKLDLSVATPCANDVAANAAQVLTAQALRARACAHTRSHTHTHTHTHTHDHIHMITYTHTRGSSRSQSGRRACCHCTAGRSALAWQRAGRPNPTPNPNIQLRRTCRCRPRLTFSPFKSGRSRSRA